MVQNTTHKAVLFLAPLTLAATILTTACVDHHGPTTPLHLPTGDLVLRVSNTSLQSEPGSSRIQLRMHVQGGLLGLELASSLGTASASTCLAHNCVEGPIGTRFGEASCSEVFASVSGETELAFGSGWLQGDTVGVDFCVSALADDVSFETVVTHGAKRSNSIRTRCTRSALGLLCGSQ